MNRQIHIMFKLVRSGSHATSGTPALICKLLEFMRIEVMHFASLSNRENSEEFSLRDSVTAQMVTAWLICLSLIACSKSDILLQECRASCSRNHEICLEKQQSLLSCDLEKMQCRLSCTRD